MSLANFAEQAACFCRTGVMDPTLDIDHARFRVYREHFRKKVNQGLKRAFPLTLHLLTPEQWQEMLNKFLAEHECSSPFFWVMPKGFVDFAQNYRYGQLINIPYLEDLLHFEWLEIEMYMMPDHPQKPFKFCEDFLNEILYLNPESRLISYCYPIFEKKSLPRAMQAGQYFVLAFRHFDHKEIHFINLSPLFKEILELLKEEELVSKEILKLVAKRFQLDEAKVLTAGEKFFQDLFNQGAILGCMAL